MDVYILNFNMVVVVKVAALPRWDGMRGETRDTGGEEWKIGLALLYITRYIRRRKISLIALTLSVST